MTWTTTSIPDLTGATAVVTGATSGLGLESARALAEAGAHVVLAARSLGKAAATCAEIRADHPNASLEVVEIDLASLASVHRAGTNISNAHHALDILINNAGLMALPERRTEDGFEMQFAVNHLGHWLLTAELMGSLLAAEAARVVTVTSTAHHMARAVDPDNVNLEGIYGPWGAYGRSKLANYHFALGLQQEFATRGLRAESLAAHPGLSHTNLQVHTVDQGGGGRSALFWKWMAAHLGMDQAQGALPQLRAATDPRAKGGQMYAPRFISNGAPVRRPILRPGRAKAIETLWAVSERATGVALEFGGDRTLE